MTDSVDYASFMIRMWRERAREPDEADQTGREQTVWVGEIESVQSGRVLPFRGLEALAELLVAGVTDDAGFVE